MQLIAEAEKQQYQASFWVDTPPLQIRKKLKELEALQIWVKQYDHLTSLWGEFQVLYEFWQAQEVDEAELTQSYEMLCRALSTLELQSTMMGQEHVQAAVLEINPKDESSHNWAIDLAQMYSQWAKQHNYKIIDLGVPRSPQQILQISGAFAFGQLRAEAGVHTLAYLPPFSVSEIMQYSQASVLVYPVWDNDMLEVDLNPEDIRQDLYNYPRFPRLQRPRVGVRLTHLPSGLRIECHQTTSQQQTVALATQLLKSRLYYQQLDKNAALPTNTDVRYYASYPQSKVQDIRTGLVSERLVEVLRGKLDMFIKAYLRQQGRNTTGDDTV